MEKNQEFRSGEDTKKAWETPQLVVQGRVSEITAALSVSEVPDPVSSGG